MDYATIMALIQSHLNIPAVLITYMILGAFGTIVVGIEEAVKRTPSPSDDAEVAKLETSMIGKVVVPFVKFFSWVKPST
jgi:hypothetical protein